MERSKVPVAPERPADVKRAREEGANAGVRPCATRGAGAGVGAAARLRGRVATADPSEEFEFLGLAPTAAPRGCSAVQGVTSRPGEARFVASRSPLRQRADRLGCGETTRLRQHAVFGRRDRTGRVITSGRAGSRRDAILPRDALGGAYSGSGGRCPQVRRAVAEKDLLGARYCGRRAARGSRAERCATSPRRRRRRGLRGGHLRVGQVIGVGPPRSKRRGAGLRAAGAFRVGTRVRTFADTRSATHPHPLRNTRLKLPADAGRHVVAASTTVPVCSSARRPGAVWWRPRLGPADSQLAKSPKFVPDRGAGAAEGRGGGDAARAGRPVALPPAVTGETARLLKTHAQAVQVAAAATSRRDYCSGICRLGFRRQCRWR